ncbi:MAG TPA: tRNA (adenosine(37)-N6)-dimethylallyltransferase MiaA [Armatimonadota bacterium]|jgi:tRNA dimethylallyltransferase
MTPIPLLVIAGPTGSGKTDTAVLAARALDGEVITADSMQVYRGMDIGTAKPTPAERQGIPHHLIDVVDPDEEFSVSQYVTRADALIRDIQARGKVAIVSGGTGFYIHALIDRWEFPPQPADLSLRERLRADVAAFGVEALHDRLRAVDAASAARLHPNDVQRVIRALEVHALTGKPLSAFSYKPGADARPGPYRPLLFGLRMQRETLCARLAERVQTQLRAGLLEEVARLYAAGYGPELSAMKGITYRQLLGFLRDEYDFDTAVELMVRDNRRYAKRQGTWFNADPRFRWLDILAVGGPSGASAEIVAAWQTFLATA